MHPLVQHFGAMPLLQQAFAMYLLRPMELFLFQSMLTPIRDSICEISGSKEELVVMLCPNPVLGYSSSVVEDDKLGGSWDVDGTQHTN